MLRVQMATSAVGGNGRSAYVCRGHVEDSGRPRRPLNLVTGGLQVGAEGELRAENLCQR